MTTLFILLSFMIFSTGWDLVYCLIACVGVKAVLVDFQEAYQECVLYKSCTTQDNPDYILLKNHPLGRIELYQENMLETYLTR